MKKIFLAILLVAPIFVFSQSKGDYFFQYNYGQVIDRYNKDDVNPYSPDVQSEFQGRDDIEMGTKYSFGYYISDDVTIGFDYMDAKSSGSNSIEYYNGQFNAANIFAIYEMKESNGITFFGKLSYGHVEFSSKRFFVYDNSQISSNSEEGTSQKISYGGGISYKLETNLELSLSITNSILDDGFDGWDHGSGTDQYLYQSIGVRIYL